MRKRLLAGIGAVLVAAMAPAGGLLAADAPDEAAALIALTRETRATYMVVSANIVYLDDGRVVREWSAEFHDGKQHRVETPRDRMVADCEAMTGVHLNVESLNVTEQPGVARAACGVHANAKIVTATVADTRQTPYGAAKHLVVTDEHLIRTYDVAPDGALLGATISGLDGRKKLVSRAIYYKPVVPAGIFSPESLAESAVPETLQRSASR